MHMHIKVLSLVVALCYIVLTTFCYAMTGHIDNTLYLALSSLDEIKWLVHERSLGSFIQDLAAFLENPVADAPQRALQRAPVATGPGRNPSVAIVSCNSFNSGKQVRFWWGMGRWGLAKNLHHEGGE